jgi:hypothetical protein
MSGVGAFGKLELSPKFGFCRPSIACLSEKSGETILFGFVKKISAAVTPRLKNFCSRPRLL